MVTGPLAVKCWFVQDGGVRGSCRFSRIDCKLFDMIWYCWRPLMETRLAFLRCIFEQNINIFFTICIIVLFLFCLKLLEINYPECFIHCTHRFLLLIPPSSTGNQGSILTIIRPTTSWQKARAVWSMHRKLTKMYLFALYLSSFC